MSTIRATDERHLINLLAMASGTRWTGLILGPTEDGWHAVYEYEHGRNTDRYLSTAGVALAFSRLHECPECCAADGQTHGCTLEERSS